jgi:integrase
MDQAHDISLGALKDSISVVIDIPARLKRFGQVMDVPLPILVVLHDGVADVPSDTYRFALSRAGVEKFEALRRMLVAISSLYDFWRASGLSIGTGEEVDLVIWNYLAGRLTGPKKVQYETVRMEFCDIRTYVRFCRKQDRLGSPFARALRAESRLFEMKMPVRPTAAFLQHLEIQRQRWLELQEMEAVFPTDLKKIATPSIKTAKLIIRFPTENQMDDLIFSEPNPMYRAAYCLLAGTGPRLSELLHMWRCDVLPPSYAGRFSGSSDGNPFIIYAHPEASTWTGETFNTRSARSRKDVLDFEYNAMSRLWTISKKERLGWKGMLLFDQRGLSWGFWVVDRYAKEFARLLPSIHALHDALGTDETHPYFWINPSDLATRGNPMRRQMLRRAIGSACVRIGIEPFIDEGGHGHGFRHFTGWFAEAKLGMSPSEKQLVLRHGDVQSQEDYGRRLADLFSKLAPGRS